MELYNELILDRDIALKDGDFETYSKLCLILDILTVEDDEISVNLGKSRKIVLKSRKKC